MKETCWANWWLNGKLFRMCLSYTVLLFGWDVLVHHQSNQYRIHRHFGCLTNFFQDSKIIVMKNLIIKIRKICFLILSKFIYIFNRFEINQISGIIQFFGLVNHYTKSGVLRPSTSLKLHKLKKYSKRFAHGFYSLLIEYKSRNWKFDWSEQSNYKQVNQCLLPICL